ncbi:MAG: hypothetical protein IPL51_08990 [Candidatus Competibacteraceae bacterium]|nr:hypothetical protein [Candidatus Competibacteraceae bacterium]
MRLTCPCCGASYGLEVLLADRSAREAVAAALGLPAGLGERGCCATSACSACASAP